MDDVSGARGNGEAKGDVIATKADGRGESVFPDSEREFIERCEAFCAFVARMQVGDENGVGNDCDGEFRGGWEKEILSIARTVTQGKPMLRAKNAAVEVFLGAAGSCGGCYAEIAQCFCEELNRWVLREDFSIIEMREDI